MSSLLPPGPRALPWVGHIPAMVRDAPAFLQSVARDYGDITTLRGGRVPFVMLNDPALIDRLVRDRSFERTEILRTMLATFLGKGLLSLEGKTHTRHRRLMQPAFHRERIRGYVAQMAEETYAWLDSVQPGSVYDMREPMMRLTFAIVSRTLFSSDTRRDAAAVNEALRAVAPAVLLQARLALATSLKLPFGPRTRRGLSRLDTLVTSIVAQRRREGGDRGDLLSMLLASRDEDGSALSDADVAAEVLTILFAGHETTAHTLTWALLLLSEHPHWQERLAEEVRDVTGGRPIGFDDLPRLVTAERILNEALRLYPPAWWTERASPVDTQFGGYCIPAHTPVGFSVFVTQRDARFFPEPLRFDPDRFAPGRAEAVPTGAYLPFGAGVHVCIGNTFALMEGRLILAALAQRFAFQRVGREPVRMRPEITLGLRDPLRLRLALRRNSAATSPQLGAR